ncbi:MAG TPA: hypothetical protein VFT99_17095 [Roseiflexaceae bacterium]|nr:hypothetical protein [Roseiflexaceae bacterium]
MTSRRTFWLASGLLALALTLLALTGPVHVSIAINRDEPRALAAPVADLPTTTPPPPTNVPVRVEPSPTAFIPTELPTAEPTVPPARREQPTPTALPESTPVPTDDPRHPNVAIVKQASVARASAGATITFSLVVANYGDAPAADVVVSDRVPDVLEVIDLHSTRGDIVLDGQTVTAYPRTLEAGQSATYSVVTRVRVGAQPGPLANTAIVTTSSHGDDPGDNTFTTTVTIENRNEPTPAAVKRPPTRLPRTGNQFADEPVLLQVWPLLLLACGAVAFGMATRRGAFRSQLVTVATGRPLSPASHFPAEPHGSASTLLLDRDQVVSRWQAGQPVRDLALLACADNPDADPAMVALALDHLLREAIG